MSADKIELGDSARLQDRVCIVTGASGALGCGGVGGGVGLSSSAEP